MLAPNSQEILFRLKEVMCAPDLCAGLWFATPELFSVPCARLWAKGEFQIPVVCLLQEGRAI